ncbi:MAG TPA: NUDIX hydrolase [Candidatus Kryptonia bacterium]|nr:NUDIX hydrolase [Candidatus Kryptonia bacterium]
MKWDLLGVEELLRCHVFTLRRHRSRSPRTGEVHDFDVIDSSDWVNVVPVTTDRQLVLVKQYRHGIGAVTLETPGGIVDPEDASPAIAGEREMREETGYTAPALIPIGVVHPNPAIQNNRLHIYLATDARRVATPAYDATEDIAVELVPLAEVDALIARGAITHSLALTALLLARLRWE